MEKNENKKNIGLKRSLIVTLVLTLVLGTYSFADFGPKAQAAEFAKIVDWDTYYTEAVKGVAVSAKLDNGKTLYIPASYRAAGYYPSYSESPEGAKNYRQYTGTYAGTYANENPGASYIDTNGDFYFGDKKWASGVKDYVVVRDRHFLLFENTTVSSWGKGDKGELGVGYKANKSALSEVVDTLYGDPITGIKKIFVWDQTSSSEPGVLLVGDGQVFLIGYGFNKNSFTDAKPLDVTSNFPAFTSAEDFDMFFLEDAEYSNQQIYGGYTDGTYRTQMKRLFVINGENYSLTNIMADDQGTVYEGLATSLTKLPSSLNLKNLKRVSDSYKIYNSMTYKYQFYANTRSTIYYQLDNGVLSYFGTTPETFAKFPQVFDPTIKTLNVGVSSATGVYTGTIWYVKNKSLYAFGSNVNNVSGVAGGALKTPVKITGPANELVNVSKFEASPKANWALLEDGTLYSFKNSNASTWTKHTVKFLDIFSHSTDGLGTQEVFGISEDYKLYYLDDPTYGFSPLTSITAKLAPEGYVAPVTKPTTPVLTTKSQDKFDQFTVGIDYGTDTGLAVKEYQINSGAWTPYTGDFVVKETGAVRIVARSADSKGNASDEAVLQITSNPIVITAGEPNVTKVSPNEFKVSAKATGAVKTQVRVDGASWQNHNVANNLLLAPGEHTIEVKLLNSKDEELISKSFPVTADATTPVVIAKPSITQIGLNSDYGLNLDVQYDTTAGEAQYSVDGGTWTATTGTISVSNDVHTVRVKVVATDGKESEVVDFVTTKTDPKVEIDNDSLKIDLGVTAPGLKVYYKDNVNGVWTEYTAPVTYPPGTYTFDVEVREDASGDVVYTGGPFTIVVTDPNAGNPGDGGTTPTPNPGTGTPVGDEDVDFTVNSGGLFARFEGADLSTIIIDSTNPYQSINSVSRALFEDSRGNAEGYQYSMDVTDFVSDPMQDNSNLQQSLVVSIPANALSVNVLSTKTLNGPVSELSHIGKHVFTGTGPEMLATAKAFEGMGYYEVPLEFTLSVPDRVKIVTSGSGSKFVPGESTGLMAGIYKSKFTLTLSSGI
ncbi:MULTISPECIES: hypothetical protein [Paenibacillus]|uniref:hypothetical protein n=1 Tax=Paenibacillus TaxID=44249 RepID=UPI0004272AD8|nr:MULTISPECIES: hypothetical protein [Paenibacillus]KGP81131.1 hypothetical protein P364_0117720 [Paenibacillus sp. MAEPY2]KGP86159.1 hypothetical protein P363_0118990 [Paenibacillus sp. MAEPY1]OZQ71040.1 hypothetical protein CA599_10910 [Paenibacillus taichungensis]